MADGAFTAWMRALDARCGARTGLSIHDLADQPFRDYFDDEMTPAEALAQILEDEGWA